MPRKKILFTDWRDIQCGALAWIAPDGARYGVGNPPEPQVAMRATPRAIPHGIRLVAQPPRKTEAIEGWKGWGRIISDEGRYRSWYLEINGHSNGNWIRCACRTARFRGHLRRRIHRWLSLERTYSFRDQGSGTAGF
ncbi:hypothetical protein HYR99_22655 [Candidatus Poribacteria bacterium]|nr:hypothetical protein [Candidatus Poribacteria bacterium]